MVLSSEKLYVSLEVADVEVMRIAGVTVIARGVRHRQHDSSNHLHSDSAVYGVA